MKNLLRKVLKGDYRRIYSLEKIWVDSVGVKERIINRSADEKVIDVMKWIDLLGRSRFVDGL